MKECKHYERGYNMLDEEKKAIEHLDKKMKYHQERLLDTVVWLRLDERYVRVLLNLIEKQQNEIDIKDIIIDLMAEQLKTPINSKKDVIEYFENLAKESGEIDENKSN